MLSYAVAMWIKKRQWQPAPADGVLQQLCAGKQTTAYNTSISAGSQTMLLHDNWL